ncbi:hypothetical protein LDC_1572 [sediment metagenome]|uniref:Uncharacterized protein n=1 Tax=sediment metagenome TaxID=749907 RepID=D9PJ63_9ZZZZ
MLLNLIIVAFVMNFSMFFGRVIIDAGNFTSSIFYSLISIESKNSDGETRDFFAPARAILGQEST